MMKVKLWEFNTHEDDGVDLKAGYLIWIKLICIKVMGHP